MCSVIHFFDEFSNSNILLPFQHDSPLGTIVNVPTLGTNRVSNASSNTGRSTRLSSSSTSLSSSSTSPRFEFGMNRRTRNRQDTTPWDRSTRRRPNNGGRPNGGRSNGHFEITNDGRGRWVPDVAAAADNGGQEAHHEEMAHAPLNGGPPAFGAPSGDAAVANRDSFSGMGGMGSPRRRGRRNRNNGDEDSDADEQAEVPIKNQEDDMSEGEQDQADQVAMAEQMKEDEMAMKQQSNCTDSNLLDTVSPELQEEIDSNLPLAEGARYRNAQRHHTGEEAHADIQRRAGSSVTLNLPGSVSSSDGPTTDQVNDATQGLLLEGERLEQLTDEVVHSRGRANYPNGAVVDWGNEHMPSRYYMSDVGRLVSLEFRRGRWRMHYHCTSDIDGYLYYKITLESGRTFWARAHRMVAFLWWGPPDDETPHVDHRNRNRSDNSYHNLSWVSVVANMANKGIYRNNTSGVTGVRYDDTRNRWNARLIVNGKLYSKNFNCDRRGKNDTDAFNRAVAYRRFLEEMRDNMNL